MVIIFLIKIFILPLIVLGLIDNPANYWQWVLLVTVFYLRANEYKLKKDKK